MSRVYYNEFDPKAAAWLRELIAQGHLAPGDVDTRSITEVEPKDLHGYTQCHFFAGIGGWSYALRLAGVSDHTHLWTGSCPCQPFSAAGLGLGEADPRHLWPAWFRLIRQCRPDTIFGEQVASKAALEWFDGVSSDLESQDYAAAAFDLCSAGVGEEAEGRFVRGDPAETGPGGWEPVLVGAPHIRQRLYWVAHAGYQQPGWSAGPREAERGRAFRDSAGCCFAGGLAQSDCRERSRIATSERRRSDRPEARWNESYGEPECGGSIGGVADPDGRNSGAEGIQRSGEHRLGPEDRGTCGLEHPESDRWVERRPEPSGRGFAGGRGLCGLGDAFGNGAQRPGGEKCVSNAASAWSDFDVLPCTDGKARRVESGTFPLAHGIPGRVGLLRGYGNAINPWLAAEFVRAYCETDCGEKELKDAA